MKPETGENASIDRLRTHIAALEGVRHPVAAPEALERAAGYVAARLLELGYGISELPVPHGRRSFRTVVATREGVLPDAGRMLLVAHYDTVAGSPGADDNASGVAVLLEAATILAGCSFERTIQFVAVPLEENQVEGDADSGTVGSSALAAHARLNGWKIDGVIVLESVAYALAKAPQGSPPGLPVAVPERGDFIAVIGNEPSRVLAGAFIRAAGHPHVALPAVPLMVPGNGERIPDSRRSDHAPFWDQGYRAIMLTDTTNFRNPHYHLPSDTLETLNLHFAAQVCDAVVGAFVELARPVS